MTNNNCSRALPWPARCQRGELRAEVEQLKALALKFLDEQTDEHAAALRAALGRKP
jgi:hypothetical protein